MRIFDITRPIYHGMPVYEGDPEVAVRPYAVLADGAPAAVSHLSMGTHTGTHVDAPAHFLSGAPGVDRLPLEVLVGPARLYDLPGPGHIGAASLRDLDLRSSARLLLKTPNSRQAFEGRFRPDYTALMGDAAHLLVEAGVRLVGLDGPSADPYASEEFPAHRILLRAGVVILESLDLSAVPPGEYELLCLPLKIRDADGAPARVLLRDPVPADNPAGGPSESPGRHPKA